MLNVSQWHYKVHGNECPARLLPDTEECGAGRGDIRYLLYIVNQYANSFFRHNGGIMYGEDQAFRDDEFIIYRPERGFQGIAAIGVFRAVPAITQ